MKKQLIILLLSLLPQIVYSQEIISRSSLTKDSGELDTVKIVNIIFAEHNKLSIENPLLKQQIDLQKQINQQTEQSNYLLKQKILLKEDLIENQNKNIKKLKADKKKITISSCVGGIVLFVIGILL